MMIFPSNTPLAGIDHPVPDEQHSQRPHLISSADPELPRQPLSLLAICGN
jgi:hypothetical protein